MIFIKINKVNYEKILKQIELFKSWKLDVIVNNNENNLLQEYIKYADKLRDSELMDKLDKFLGEIKWQK